MTDYYLATDGSDSNAGTKDQPFASLQTLLSALSAGDNGYIRGGNYYPTGFADGSDQQGSDGSPIRLQAYDGETVVCDFSNDTYGGMRLWSCSYWELRDFEIRNAPSYGLYLFGGTDFCTIENVTVDGSGGDSETSGAGIYLYNAPDNTVRNCVSKNNYDPSSGGGNADGFGAEGSPRSLFEDCVAHGNSDDGFDLWKAENETLRRCVAHGNGYDPDGNEAGDGNGFKLGGGSTSGGHRVERCVSYRNATRGFHYNEADVPVEVYNCTAWDNPRNYWFAEVQHVLRNNISSQGEVTLGSAVDHAYNTWNLGITSPSFESIDPSSSDFLRLASDSPAIDAGTDVGLSFDGEAPDLGAYEMSSDSGGDSSTSSPTLRVATTDGTFQAGTVNYYDGSAWTRPRVAYYDGSSWVELASGSGGGDGSTDSSVVDSFESGDISAYTGDTDAFGVMSDRATDGSQSLVSTGSGNDWTSIHSTSGLDTFVPHGSTFRVNVYLTDTLDSAIARFGVGGPGNWIGAGWNSNNGAIQVSEAVDGNWSQIGQGSITAVASEWMEWEIEWGVDSSDQVAVTCYDASGTEIGSASASTSSHQSDDGVGFEYTFQYGGTGPVYFDHLRTV
ncbi:MAG: right-handed parallel beta-helix repeat-containing protein [Haloarculaceae archaeon]